MTWNQDILEENNLVECTACDSITPIDGLYRGVCEDCRCAECGDLLIPLTQDGSKCIDTHCNAINIYNKKKMRFEVAVNSLGEIV